MKADPTTATASLDEVFTTIEATGEYPTFVALATKAGWADTLRTGAIHDCGPHGEGTFSAPPATVKALGTTELA